MRNAYLCIGISNYAPEGLEAGEAPLNYATLSATAIAERMRSLWSISANDAFLCLDERASSREIKTALGSLSGHGAFDGFVFYFAGHGRKGAILTQDGDRLEAVSGEKILRLCERVKAHSRLIMFDCCYAGSLVPGSQTPTAPGTTIITSTGDEDRAWEVSELQRTCFAAALDASLAKLTPQATIGAIVSDFAHIRGDTAASAFGLISGERQQPELHGAMAQSVRPLTEWTALRRRLRQVLVATACTVAAIAGLAMLATYRVGLDAEGRIAIYYGHKSLSFLNFGPFEIRRKTRFQSFLITPDPQTRDKLQREEIWGIWTRRNAVGLPVWIDQIVSIMTPAARQHSRLRLGLPTDLAKKEFGALPLATWTLLNQLDGDEQSKHNHLWATYFPNDLRICGPTGSQADTSSLSRRRCRDGMFNMIRAGAAVSNWFDAGFVQNLIAAEQSMAPRLTFRGGPLDSEGFSMMRIADAIADRLELWPAPATRREISVALARLQQNDTALRRLSYMFAASLATEGSQELERKLWQERENAAATPAIDPMFGLHTLARRNGISNGLAALKLTLKAEPPDYMALEPFDILFASGSVSVQHRSILAEAAERRLETLRIEQIQPFFPLVRMLARQAPYMGKTEFSQLTALVDRLDTKIHELLKEAGTAQKEIGSFVVHELRGLLAMNQETSSALLATLAPEGWTEDDYMKEPTYNHIVDVPRNRLAHGLRVVAAARAGLARDLPGSARQALESYAVALATGQRPFPPDYLDQNQRPVIQLDDIGVNGPTLFLSLARLRYHSTRPVDLVPALIERLGDTIEVRPRALVLEENAAAVWLRSQTMPVQKLLFERLRQAWRSEPDPNIRFSLAQVLILASATVNMSNSSAAVALGIHNPSSH